MPIVITPAIQENSAAIAEITRKTYAATYRHQDGSPCFTDAELEALSQSVEVPSGESKSDERIMLVAKIDNVVVGYALMCLGKQSAKTTAPGVVIDDKTAFLSKLYVDPEHQGCGVGNYLMIQMLRRAIAHGKTKMELEVWDGNAKSVAYYERNNFKVVSEYNYPPVESGIQYTGYHMENTELEMTRRQLVIHQLEVSLSQDRGQARHAPSLRPTRLTQKRSVRFLPDELALGNVYTNNEAEIAAAIRKLRAVGPSYPGILLFPRSQAAKNSIVEPVTPPNSPVLRAR